MNYKMLKITRLIFRLQLLIFFLDKRNQDKSLAEGAEGLDGGSAPTAGPLRDSAGTVNYLRPREPFPTPGARHFLGHCGLLRHPRSAGAPLSVPAETENCSLRGLHPARPVFSKEARPTIFFNPCHGILAMGIED